jgi:hypothetical protein
MQLLVPMKSILTLEGRRCNHGSGIFGIAVSCFLREPDLASRKPVLTQALQDPNSSSCHTGVAVLAPVMAAIRNQRM